MASSTEQFALLTRRLDSLQAGFTGLSANPGIFAALGSVILYGCKVTEGSSSSDLTLALEAAASGDTDHLNPNLDESPLYPFEYGNIASIAGGGFYTGDLETTMEAAPGATLGRYDIAYIAAGPSGPVFSVVTGTPGTAVKDDFDLNGLKTTPYDSGTDAAIPVGAMAVARIYIEGTDTGIGNARIADLRNFEGRLKGDPFTWADMTPTQKNELIDPAAAAATTAVLADNEEFKREQRTLFWLGI